MCIIPSAGTRDVRHGRVQTDVHGRSWAGTIDQPGGRNLLTKACTKRYQFIVSSAMYLAQAGPYGILYGVNELAGVMSNPSKVHLRATKHLRRYLGLASTSTSPTSERAPS